MSPAMAQEFAETLGFPRVSGDEPRTATDFRAWYSFSPRERG